MTRNQKIITLVLLICGLLFSSMILIKFNLSEGFIFHGFQVKMLPLPLYDLAYEGSTELQLTSAIIGYGIFVATGIYWLREVQNNMRWLIIVLGYVGITIIAVYQEASSMIQDINGEFAGQHFRVGPTLFILGLVMFFRIKSLDSKSN